MKLTKEEFERVFRNLLITADGSHVKQYRNYEVPDLCISDLIRIAEEVKERYIVRNLKFYSAELQDAYKVMESQSERIKELNEQIEKMRKFEKYFK